MNQDLRGRRKSPRVSVILPTYNRLVYLQNAFRTVLEQTWSDWELLVLNDGSSDGTSAWLDTIEDTRVRVFSRPHTGAVSALRNAGIAESRGEWLAFLDDDDAWHPEKLERQMALHRSHAEWRWSYTAVTSIDSSGRPIPPNPNRPWRPLAGRIVLPVLTIEASIALPSVVVHRDLLARVRGFDERLDFAMDYDLWLRLARQAEVGVLDDELTFVRSHLGSRTAHQPGVNIAFVRVYEKFAVGATSSEREICRCRQAFHEVRLSRQWLALGQRKQACNALFRAIRLRPFYPWAWRTVAKTLVGS
jgi:glycosyltransferase involved in cell wall biosynthesis